ncbi:hypothetical protein E8E14_002435 [Neopestalotiopsis sp. 37M]|nr:hypothetical protein E8E14_002435 [Neopestalotiopsis sp. 37M]
MVKVLAPAFVGHPVYAWFLSDYPISEHEKMLHALFRAFLTQAYLNNGIFIEAGNFGACGLLMPPGSMLQNPRTLLQAGLFPAVWTLGLGTFKRVLVDFSASIEPILKKALTPEEQRNHWYGAFMGTGAECRQQGLATSVFFHMLERSRSDGLPICFEAATERTRDMYLKHGGKVMGECVIGKGKVGADGMPNKSGEGFVIWPMIWRP